MLVSFATSKIGKKIEYKRKEDYLGAFLIATWDASLSMKNIYGIV
jgi:hypothetical protein